MRVLRATLLFFSFSLVEAALDDDPNLFRPVFNAAHAVSLGKSSAPSLARRSGLAFARADSLLLGRQDPECEYPGGPICSATTCCPVGDECCPDGCCEEGYNCPTAENPNKCCPVGAETCGGALCVEAGSVCCGTEFACPAGQPCNVEAGGCCPEEDWIQCPTTCCPPGSACTSEEGICSRLTSSVSATPTSTVSQQSTQSVSTSTSTKYSTTTICPSPTAVRQRAADDEPSRVERLQERQQQKYPMPTACVISCHQQSGQKLPLFEIPNIPGVTDELFESMCAGMDGWYKRQLSGIEGAASTIYTDLANGEDILTYGGPGRNNADKKQRRADVNCREFQTSNCAALTASRGIQMECDEYPPAMFTEGGGLATRVCVPQDQNSKLQGPLFSNVQRLCGLKNGDKVLIRLAGGCNQFNFPPRRKARDKTVTISGANSTLISPYLDGSLNFVGIPLGELDPGHYSIQANFPGTVVQAEVLNQYGDSYAVIVGPPSTGELSFDVDDDMALSGSLIAYTLESFNLSYSGSEQLVNLTSTTSTASTTSTSTSSPSATPQSAANARDATSSLSFLSLVVFLSTLLAMIP